MTPFFFICRHQFGTILGTKTGTTRVFSPEKATYLIW